MIGDTREMFVLMLAAASFLSSCSELRDEPTEADHPDLTGLEFNYISVNDGRIRTLHELKYMVLMDGDFQVTKPKNRVAQFNGRPYRISVAAFISDDTSLMIHAEEVADSSGASDYSHLPPATWPDDTFRSSGPDCLQIPAEEIEGEHDLLWLRHNGFEPSGSMMYAQYFASTADMNSEVVISILQRVKSCPEVPADSEIISEIQAKASIVRIE